MVIRIYVHQIHILHLFIQIQFTYIYTMYLIQVYKCTTKYVECTELVFYETYSVLYHNYSLHREFHNEHKSNHRAIMLNYLYIKPHLCYKVLIGSRIFSKKIRIFPKYFFQLK